MKTLALAAALCGVAVLPSLRTAPSSLPQDPPSTDMKAMQEKAARLIRPGPNHKILERFLGTWTHEIRFWMGDKPTPPKRGETTFSWLMDGRWMKGESRGQMFGKPTQNFFLIGYDNFKQSFVTTSVSSVDTAMLHSEGDMTPDGKALIAYGTLDEYLTGEHDKMVKYVWRFVSDDEIVQEVHDLPIGETNTKVVEIRYQRKK